MSLGLGPTIPQVQPLHFNDNDYLQNRVDAITCFWQEFYSLMIMALLSLKKFPHIGPYFI